ncbi:MAG: efflux RND transporter periplasmic adaptor subunit, partial [Actinobacteria bacterium]|nr:efflux RND transporter periplasmic adaptor subunit [Actinomycetota bacterium]
GGKVRRWTVLKILVEVTVVVAVLALVSGGCGGSKADVSVTKIKAQPIEESLLGTGTLHAANPNPVIPQVSGFVAEVCIKDGQQVTEGQVLVQMETDQLEQSVLSAKGSIESIQSIAGMFSGLSSSTSGITSALQGAMTSVDAGLQGLFELERVLVPLLPENQRLTALQAIDASYNNYVIQRENREPISIGGGGGGYNNSAQLASARKGLEIAEKNLEKATIKAPVSGTIVLNSSGGLSMEGMMAMMMTSFSSMMPAGLDLSSLSGLSGMMNFGMPSGGALTPGSFIMPGTELFSIINLSDMSVSVKVPETDIAKLRLGQKAAVTLEAFPGETLTGIVDYISNSATTNEAGAVAFDISVKLDPMTEENINLKIGMTGMVNIIIDTKEATVVVPIESVMEKDGKKYVFVSEDSTAILSEVKTGLTTDDRIEITSGVKVGDSIVIKGADKLKDGQKI